MLELLKRYGAPLAERDTWLWLLLPVVVAVAMLAFDRYAVEHRFAGFFAEQLRAQGATGNDLRFAAQAWLSASCVVLLVLLPCLYLWALPLRPPARQTWGFGARHVAEHLPVYLAFTAVMVPVLWIAAGTDSFRFFYPLYDPTSWQRWLAFEVIYLTQFFCVEFFFRGPLLFRLETRFGAAAIGMMMVPYALLHIYKPMPEALGAIVAGLLLGALALHTRSIWPGVMLHCGVALTMDVFALLRSGRLDSLF